MTQQLTISEFKDSSAIIKLLEEGITHTSPLCLESIPANMTWQDRAYEINMRLAQKTESISIILDDVKEKLRDLGSEDTFDVRGKAVGCFHSLNSAMQCLDLVIALDTETCVPLLEVNRLEFGEHVTFMVPISSSYTENVDLIASWTRGRIGGGTFTVGDHTAQLELAYGWLDSLETCYSTIYYMNATDAATAAQPMKEVITFKCKNHFEGIGGVRQKSE